MDALCVAIPSAVAGAILFALTGGFLQWHNPGLQAQTCTPVTSIPANLVPPPPENSNRAQLCSGYSIAGPVSRVLIVTRVTKDGNTTTTVSNSYSMMAAGTPGGHDLSWVTLLGLLALLIGGEWRTGTTPGKRLLGIRVVSTRDPQARSIPLRQIATRYGIAIGFYIGPFVLAFAVLFISLSQSTTPGLGTLLAFFALLVIASVWSIWNTVRIVRRRPTIYDAKAGVEIVRVVKAPSSVRPATPDAPVPA